MFHYIGMFIGSLLGADKGSDVGKRVTEPTPLRKLWPCWLLLGFLICLYGVLCVLFVTQQRQIDLAECPDAMHDKGVWVRLAAEDYEIIERVGSDHIAPGMFSYVHRDADVYLVDVDGRELYVMVESGELDNGEVDLFGQCWGILDYMNDSDFPGYLLDKGQTQVDYYVTGVLYFAVFFGCLWLAWFLPTRVKKRNAEIERAKLVEQV